MLLFKELAKSILPNILIRKVKSILMRDNVSKVRQGVNKFLDYCKHGLNLEGPILDIGPQKNSYSALLFNIDQYEYKTLDIDPNSDADLIADICKMPNINSDSFSTIICTEVLEHTLNPFNAVNELFRILKPNGYLLVSTPFNLRIHGPNPDCWRFTEEGLNVLFGDKFIIKEIRSIKSFFRLNMPIQYQCILKK